MSTSNNSTNSNQQTLAESRANERPPMLEKGNYIPWESRFRRFLDNKLEDGERMWNSIQNGPYQRPMVVDPTNPTIPILELLSKMTEGNKKQYIADVRVMNYLLQVIPNDIYNSVDASKEGESLDSVHERLTTLMNIIDRNNVRPIPVAFNTKFLNCLQPELSKYVTKVRHNQTRFAVSYDVLYDLLVQFEPHVLASRAKKASKNHDPLALLAHSNASSSHSHANSSYSPQSYYVTHPPSVVDYDDEYQGKLQGDSQEDKLTTAMMNQVVVQDGRVDIQTKNAGYGGNANKNTGRNRTQGFNTGNAGHYARECQKLKVRDAKYFREKMLLAMKDEAGSNLSNEENDFMLDTSYGEDLEELTVAVVSQVHASSKVHEQVSHGKHKTIIQTMNDDKIDSNIIFNDSFVENNGGTSEHDSTTYDEYREIIQYRYLDDILDLEEKLSSHDRIVYKMGQSIQTIHMLGKKPNKVYDPFLKAGLGYTNHVRLKKAIAAQPKMYDGDLIHSDKLLNALYETFVPQQELSAEQTYFLIASTSDNGSKSKDVPSESPSPKMANESRLLKMIDTLGDTIIGFQTRINKTFLQDTERRWLSDSQNELREFYKTYVISMSRSLYKTLSEIKEEL
ncbi:hypothetical protein Tco_0801718 [Tanacetum coccineum]|uniref:Uncharacterized protein n=1 Tax=Tanacetum coccineum TaxID=301880 RepID=A0ABQ5A0R8_9ASTR